MSKDVVKIGSIDELVEDLVAALQLLEMAGPNPLVCDNEDEYWKELHRLQDKYILGKEE